MKVNASSQTVSAILMCAWLAAGCAHTHRDTSVRELFAKIQIGMSRSQVDALLGPPTAPQLSPDADAWYLPSPRIKSHESPFAPGTIGIRFTDEGRVASKTLNPQAQSR